MGPAMRKALKFLHTLGAAAYIGALLAYAVILTYAPQGTPRAYADMRASIDLICSYLLVPSLGIVLVSGLLAMAAHKPFLDLRWVWIKAALGIGTFEGTLVIVSGRARSAAGLAEDIAAGKSEPAALAAVIASEWGGLAVIGALAVANVVLGVWRPALWKPAPAGISARA